MDIYETIALRKSVREFTAKDIPEAMLTRLLESARLAPSASNRQEWRFVVIRDQDTREKIAQASFGQVHVAQAPFMGLVKVIEIRHVAVEESAVATAVDGHHVDAGDNRAHLLDVGQSSAGWAVGHQDMHPVKDNERRLHHQGKI